MNSFVPSFLKNQYYTCEIHPSYYSNHDLLIFIVVYFIKGIYHNLLIYSSLINIWITSNLKLLWISPNIFCICLLVHICTHFYQVEPKSRIISNRVYLCSAVVDTAKQFSPIILPIYTPINLWKSILAAQLSYQHLVSSVSLLGA